MIQEGERKRETEQKFEDRTAVRCLIGQHRKNTFAKLGRHLVSCSLRAGMEICVKVDRTSMMKSREYDETNKSGGLLRKNRSSSFESVFGKKSPP